MLLMVAAVALRAALHRFVTAMTIHVNNGTHFVASCCCLTLYIYTCVAWCTTPCWVFGWPSVFFANLFCTFFDFWYPRVFLKFFTCINFVLLLLLYYINFSLTKFMQRNVISSSGGRKASCIRLAGLFWFGTFFFLFIHFIHSLFFVFRSAHFNLYNCT